MLTVSADDTADSVPPAGVCRAVNACGPSANAAAPLIVIEVVVDDATALPTGLPSAYSVTVAPATVPDTWKLSAVAGEALLKFVTLSSLKLPLSLASLKSTAIGAAGSTE